MIVLVSAVHYNLCMKRTKHFCDRHSVTIQKVDNNSNFLDRKLIAIDIAIVKTILIVDF